MDLPILSQPTDTDPQALVRAARRAEQILTRTLAEERQVGTATVFIDTRRPGCRIANRAFDIPPGSGPSTDDAIGSIAALFKCEGGACGMLSLSEPTWPDDLAEQAVSAGYVAQPLEVLMLHEYTRPARVRDDLQIIPARASYHGVRELHALWAREAHADNPTAADQTAQAMTDQLDEPRLDAFLARQDDQPVGIAAVLSLGQVGVIRGVFTHPDARGRAVATTLVAHTLDHCSRAQFTQVLTTCPPVCPSNRLYQSIGFTPAAQYTDYLLP